MPAFLTALHAASLASRTDSACTTTKPATERAFLFQEFAVLKTIATWVLTAIGTLAFLTLQAVLDGR